MTLHCLVGRDRVPVVSIAELFRSPLERVSEECNMSRSSCRAPSERGVHHSNRHPLFRAAAEPTTSARNALRQHETTLNCFVQCQGVLARLQAC
eukprot:15483194-Alexandrium_andersonii.AAC.3